MWRFWRVNWILRVHMYLLIWRKTNFFSGISIVSLNQISKLTKLICLHFIGCRNYTKILTNRASYLIIVTVLLPFLSKHITSALTAVKDHAKKKKKKEIWPSPMTKPPIPTENSKNKGQHTHTPPKSSITQQLRTDLGRSVGVTSINVQRMTTAINFFFFAEN